jgi:hypothetical protein
MSPGTSLGSPEKRSRAAPAGSSKRLADEADLGEQVGGLLDMPPDTPHEIEDVWNRMKHDWIEGMEEDLARLHGIGDEKELQQLRDFDV